MLAIFQMGQQMEVKANVIEAVAGRTGGVGLKPPRDLQPSQPLGRCLQCSPQPCHKLTLGSAWGRRDRLRLIDHAHALIVP